MKSLISIAFLILSTGFLHAHRQNEEVLKQNLVLTHKIDSIKIQQEISGSKLEELIKNNIVLKESLLKLEADLLIAQKQSLSDKKNKRFGALILLFGLLLEVLGVIFLSSESLSSEIQKIRPYKVENTFAELGGNRNLKSEIITLQIIGIVFLVFGFSFQFIGTLLVLTSNLIFYTIGIITILLLIFVVSAIVVKYIGRGSIIKKFNICIHNFKGIIMFRIEDKFFKRNKVVCEACYKPVQFSESTIEYLQPIKKHTVNYPRNFHIGHEKCIDKIFEINKKHPNDEYNIISMSLLQFYDSHFNKIKLLLNERIEKHGDWDDEFKQTIKRLGRMKNTFTKNFNSPLPHAGD